MEPQDRYSSILEDWLIKRQNGELVLPLVVLGRMMSYTEPLSDGKLDKTHHATNENATRLKVV